MLIWRPVMARRITLGEVKRGEVTLVDLLKINALMDMELATEHAARVRAAKKNGKPG